MYGKKVIALIMSLLIVLNSLVNQTGNYVMAESIDEIESEVEKLPQEGFDFENSGPITVEYTSPDSPIITNVATGGVTTATTTYASLDVNVATVDDDGNVYIVSPGTTTIVAIKGGDDLYKEVAASYELIVKLGIQTLTFENGNDITVSFPETTSYINQAISDKTSDKATYSITSGNELADINANTGEVTIKKPGKVTVTAWVDDNGYYDRAEASYDLDIVDNRVDQPEFSFAQPGPIIKTYDSSALLFSNPAIGGSESPAVYTSSNEEVATVDENGIVTIIKVGTTTITAYKEGDSTYFETSISYDLVIEQADQQLSFEKGNSDTITYKIGGTYSNIATSDKTFNKITYMIQSGHEYADINSETGEVTVKGVGTVIVSANIEGDSNYNDASISYTLTISMASQQLSFENGSDVWTYYGYSKYSNRATSNRTSNKITYSILSGQEFADIDSDSGEITIKGAGSVTVKAKVEGDTLYNSASAEYNLEIRYLDIPSKSYTLVGPMGKNGWFTGDVTIVAPKGYEISTSNTLSDNTWSNSLDSYITSDGIHNISLYLKNEIGITDAINIKIKKDVKAPSIKIKTEGATWDNSPESSSVIIFKYFCKKNLMFEIESSDETSGIDTVKYYIHRNKPALSKTDLDNLNESLWEIGEKATINDPNKYIIYVKVLDKAGNYNYVSSDGIIFDTTKPTVTCSPITESINGIYNKDVNININVEDLEPSAGIKEIKYRIENNGVITQQEKLYDITVLNDSITSWNGNILIDSTVNNSNNVVLFVDVMDNVGNITSEQFELKIDIIRPTISVYFDKLDAKVILDGRGYYDSARIATISIKERTENFNPLVATESINISAKDGKGNTILLTDVTISNWLTVEGDTPDDAIHTAKIVFNQDGNYDLSISYSDNAGNANNTVDYGTSEYPTEFTIDSTAPTGTIKIADSIWSELINALTFGLWSNSSVNVTGSGTDYISPIKSIEYYKSNQDTALSINDLENLDLAEWNEFNNFTMDTDEQFTVYLKITDIVGNYSYISSNGYIIDKRESSITLNPSLPNESGYYNSDVKVDIQVEDIEPYSGIATIDYRVESDGTITQQGVLFKNSYSNPTKEELLSSWAGNFMVDSKLNNSDKVNVYVTVTDNAGNQSTSSIELKINSSIPTIDIKFEEFNSAGKGNYYNQPLKATVIITDRTSNFDPVSATQGIKINAKNGLGNSIEIPMSMIPTNWITVEGDSPNNATHTATIEFNIDANYTVDFSYTNLAGSSSNGYIITGNNKSPAFTIDTTNPIGEIKIAERVWNSLLSAITFGIWSNTSFELLIDAQDHTSPLIIQYFKTSNTKVYTKEQLDLVTDWITYQPMKFSKDEQFVVYAKVTDSAGNYIYLSSNGHIIDKTPASVQLRHSGSGRNGIYSSNVNVDVTVSDPAPYSGIKEIRYEVISRGNVTQSGVLFTFDKNSPKYEELVHQWAGKINVDASKNNSDNVQVIVKVKDNANNESNNKVTLNIDNTAPTISVSFNDSGAYKIVEGKGYFNQSRIATVVITERTSNFDPSNVSGFNATGGWSTREGSTPDSATHTAQMHFDQDGEYTFNVSFTDKAGNSTSSVNYNSATTPNRFIIDKTKPYGSIEITKFGVWKELLTTISFGLWSNEEVEVIIQAKDDIAQIDTIQYYKTTGAISLSEEDLDNLAKEKWIPYTTLKIKPNEQFVIYAKLTDNAGNYIYLSSNGIILDDTKPIAESITPEIKIEPQQPINGIYSSDVKVAISVVDPIINNTYSGIRNISYEVSNMGAITQSGMLFSFDNLTNPKKEQLVQKWNGNIVVDSLLNNSNDVVIKVKVTDNTGLESNNSIPIKIDITKPTITIAYDNNTASIYQEAAYFKQNRTATITVQERNFNPKDFKLDITNSDGIIPALSQWKTTAGKQNGDDTVHQAVVVFNSDGDYTLAASFKDMAGNNSVKVNYGDSLTPEKFTIDKTVPTLDITYDNMNAKNNNYYNKNRVATIRINEHNFDEKQVLITLTAKDNNIAKTAPAISKWNSNGDIHTAVINFNEDGLYTIDVEYSDKAQNVGADFNKQEFYIDKTAPILTITGIRDGSANNSDLIGFTIEAKDANLDSFTPLLILHNLKTPNKEVSQLFGKPVTSKNSIKYTVENVIEDGIYYLNGSLVDKAGNPCIELFIEQDGSEPTIKTITNDKLIKFSTNRKGSTFELDSYVQQIINKYYVKEVEQHIIINEINVDELVEQKVVLNKKELKKGVDYTVKHTKYTDTGWNQYTYTINSSLFANEGDYSIVITSKDKTGSAAYSDIKGSEILFVVDKTEPEINISGLQNSGRYNTETQTATVVFNDPGAKLYRVTVVLNDKDTVLDLSDEELVKYLEVNSNQVTFDVPLGYAQSAKIICTDMAGNTITKVVDNITISNDWYVLYYANKTLFYCSVAGVAVIAIGITSFFVFRKKAK